MNTITDLLDVKRMRSRLLGSMCRFLVPTAAYIRLFCELNYGSTVGLNSFSSVKPYEVNCRITAPSQQLLAASQTGDAIGFRQLLCTTSFDTVELEIAMNFSVHSQSVNASFT